MPPPLPSPITSRTNAKVKELRAVFSGKGSKPGELAGIEGWKTVQQAAEAGLQIDTLVFSTEADAASPAFASLRAAQRLVVSPEVMASAVDILSPPPVAATVVIPAADDIAVSPSGIFLLLEDLQDPGNVGTLIRSAEAFGVERVFLTPKCANPWSPKVIRASAGSVFRQPVEKAPISSSLQVLREKGVRTAGAVAEGQGAGVSLLSNLPVPVALVVGNEGAGLSKEVLAQVDERIYIPCFTESLNAAVAGSVLLYEVFSQRQRRMAAAEDAKKGDTPDESL